MRRVVSGISVLSAGVVGLALSSCGVAANSPSLSSASHYGQSGGRFEASFPSRVRETTYLDAGTRQPQYGVGALNDVEYSSGSGAPPTVNVSVETLTNVVPRKRARAFLRSFLASAHGGRIIDRQGHLAAVEIVPGCNPSGQCVGDVGTLAVLDGNKVFTVWTAQPSVGAAKAELRTFALAPD